VRSYGKCRDYRDAVPKGRIGHEKRHSGELTGPDGRSTLRDVSLVHLSPSLHATRVFVAGISHDLSDGRVPCIPFRLLDRLPDARVSARLVAHEGEGARLAALL